MVQRNSERTVFDLLFLCTLVLLVLATRPSGVLFTTWNSCHSCAEVSSFFAGSAEAVLYTGRSILASFLIVLDLMSGIAGIG